jgi:hypothetical protein
MYVVNKLSCKRLQERSEDLTQSVITVAQFYSILVHFEKILVKPPT